MWVKIRFRIYVEAFCVGLIFSSALFIPESSMAVDGAQLFSAKCVACHGSKGKGTQVGPALKGDPFVIQGTPEEIKKVIMMGRTEKEKKYPNIMIPMPTGLVSDTEADALVTYLKGDLQK
jgi:mono/diheme cytochrome c family protein